MNMLENLKKKLFRDKAPTGFEKFIYFFLEAAFIIGFLIWAYNKYFTGN